MEASDHTGCVCLIHILLLSLHFSAKKTALPIFILEIQNIAETTLQQQMNLLHMHWRTSSMSERNSSSSQPTRDMLPDCTLMVLFMKKMIYTLVMI